MMRLPDGQLDGASASFAKGVLTLQIPFLAGVSTWDELTISLIGLQFLQTARNQNQIGWMTYCDPSGNILWAGPITAFDAFLWHWVHAFMPLREGGIASFLPLFTLVSPTLLVLSQLRQNLGSQLPPGLLTIMFYGAILQETGQG